MGLSNVCESGAVHLLRVLEEVHLLDEYANFFKCHIRSNIWKSFGSVEGGRVTPSVFDHQGRDDYSHGRL